MHDHDHNGYETPPLKFEEINRRNSGSKKVGVVLSAFEREYDNFQ